MGKYLLYSGVSEAIGTVEIPVVGAELGPRSELGEWFLGPGPSDEVSAGVIPLIINTD